ncbi:Alpha/Beta hydrolase protein [Astrocystis sublimbata]|nr:Alpha/Beta hydrolase protein [Astrocystis sublimbata]
MMVMAMRCNTICILAATLVGLSLGTPLASNAVSTPTVVLPAGNVTGSVADGVEYFRGIPYAQPPTGALRLKPPVRIKDIGSFQATGVGPACPQSTAIDFSPLLLTVATLPDVQQTLFFGSADGDETEDCLTISVMRPQGVAADAKLPVLFWIFGGGFQTGSPQMFNGSVLIPQSVAQGKPILLVAVNYRLGAFGFLGGSEVLADGAANLGLLDQRMGLEWVAKNIAAFGGDPDAVTIWGESAGAISVFDQLALFDGDSTYNGRPLFRGAIMDSGSILPTEPVDGVKAQDIFDTVAAAAGCESAAAGSAKLECLRAVDYDTFLNASNSVPSYLGYNSLAFSFAPRPDGRILTACPSVLAQTRKYAAVPIIIGNQENDGTIFALFQSNITTESDLVSYFSNIFFPTATRDEVAGLVATYPKNPKSPPGIGASNATYPEFKRLAAILGDYYFDFMSRLLLETFPKTIPAWSYLSTYGRGTPILGTYHSTELPRIYYETDPISTSIQDLYISFVNTLNPNQCRAGGRGGYLTSWKTWQKGGKLLELGARSTRLVKDGARTASFEYVRAHLEALRL